MLVVGVVFGSCVMLVVLRGKVLRLDLRVCCLSLCFCWLMFLGVCFFVCVALLFVCLICSWVGGFVWVG